ncbi:hypothetical protein [Kitasatospora sp. NPDC097643]|uniref:hypothetical protein n=1 Tax=Kitasatospora sp. NPDC097643 TaxID=3157230 RepID=UPI00332C7146
MASALQLNTDLTIETIELPDDPALWRRAVTTRLSGSPDRAVYHRRALMWLHGNGANERMPANLVATALASAWRGLDIGASYFLYGRVLITGRRTGTSPRWTRISSARRTKSPA